MTRALDGTKPPRVMVKKSMSKAALSRLKAKPTAAQIKRTEKLRREIKF